MKSPLSTVKEQFGDKLKLVSAVEKLATDDLWLDRLSEAKGLAHVSNAKLLKLHSALTLVKSEFGSRSKLIQSILELEKRAKDAGYQARLEKFTIPRLVDLHRSAKRRSARAAAASAVATEKKRVVRSKKAQAKAAAK